jgi:hypothetical protein
MADILKMDTPAEEPTKKYHKDEILLMRDLINAFGSGFDSIGELLYRDEAQIAGVTQPVDRTMVGLWAWVSEVELRTLVERSQSGKRANARELGK